MPSFHRLPEGLGLLRECTRPSSSDNHEVAEKLGALLDAYMYAAKNRDHPKIEITAAQFGFSRRVVCGKQSLQFDHQLTSVEMMRLWDVLNYN